MPGTQKDPRTYVARGKSVVCEQQGVIHKAGDQQKYLLQPIMPQLNTPPIAAAVSAAKSSAKMRTPTPSTLGYR